MGKAIDMEPDYVGAPPKLGDFEPDYVGTTVAPPAMDPLRQAIAVLHKLASPAARPDAVVGEDLMQPAVPGADMTMRQQQLEAGRPNVQDASLPITGQSTVAPGQPQNRPDFAVGVDRIGAEKGTPDVSGTAGFDPNANQYTPPKVPGTVDEANREVADQIAKVAATHEKHNQALLAAQASHANAQADIYEEGAVEATVLGEAHQRRIAHINAMADAETANHLTKLEQLAKTEPNPARWWENQSGLGKALWALSLVFGAANAALTPGAKNAALDMVRQEIASDMARQEARTKREMAIEELRMTEGEKKASRNRSDAMDRYSRELTRWQALERAYVARATAPNDMDAQAAKAEGMAFLEQQKLPIIMGFRQEKVAAAEAKANREFQAAQQARAQKFQEDQAMLDRNLRDAISLREDKRARDLAALQFSVKGGIPTDAKGRPVDEHGIPVLREAQSGIGRNVLTVDPVTRKPVGDGVARFRDDKTREEFEEVTRNADERFHDLVQLRDLMKAKGAAAKAAWAVGGVFDPQVEMLLKRIGYGNAKALDPRGIVTNADFANGVQTAMGFNPDGNKLDRAKTVAAWDDITKMLDDEISRMPDVVGNTLSKKLDKSINSDAAVLYQPPDLNVKRVDDPTQNQVEGRPPTDYRVKSADEYDKLRTKDVGPAEGQYLPPHDKTVVDSLKKAAVGRGPEGVTAEAARILKQLDKREEAITEQPEKMDFTGPLAGSVFNRQTLTQEQSAELQRIRTTREIVSTLAQDEVKTASAKLKRVERWLRERPFKLSRDQAEEMAKKKFGLQDAPREIRELVEKTESAVYGKYE